MKDIEFPDGTYQVTKERVSALAWLANRQGKRNWVDKDTTRVIQAALIDHGYFLDLHQMRVAMKWLVRMGYAYERMSEGSRKVKEFGFMPNINLQGFQLPKPKATKDKGVEELEKIKAQVLDKPAPIASMPPLPGAPIKEPPYRLDELSKRLEEWHEANPEMYAQWVDMALDSLEKIT